MKRMLSILLVLVIAQLPLHCLAAAEEPVVLRIAVTKNFDDHSDGFDSKPIVEEINAATGIQVEWIEIPQSAVNERKAVLLAAELPDVFLNVVTVDDISANPTLFLPLNDLLEDNMPNLVADFNQYGEEIWQTCTWPDGNIYALTGGFFSAPANESSALPLINTAWLDTLGLDVPTTLDDYYNVLKAFKEGDPNGNGLADEIPLSFCDNYWASYFKFLAGNFGFTDYYSIRDGEVVGVAGTEAYREFVEFYHKLAAENLLDVEGFSQTEEQFKSKLKNNVVGTFFGWRPGVELGGTEIEGDYFTFFPAQDEIYASYPSVPGAQGKFSGNAAMFAITTACKNPEAALRWWDYAHKDMDTKLNVMIGKQGITWDQVDGVYYDIEVNPETDPNGYGRAYWRYYYSLGTAGPIVYEAMNFLGYEEDPLARINLNNNVREKIATREESMPNRIITASVLEERKNIESDLMDYIRNFTATAVLNGIDDTQWAEHLKMLEAYKYDEWIAWQQNYYDGTF